MYPKLSGHTTVPEISGRNFGDTSILNLTKKRIIEKMHVQNRINSYLVDGLGIFGSRNE